jgi:CoA transferase family III
LYRIAERADVIVQNFRPGVMAKLGLGYDDFRRVNSRIIYCSGSGERALVTIPGQKVRALASPEPLVVEGKRAEQVALPGPLLP